MPSNISTIFGRSMYLSSTFLHQARRYIAARSHQVTKTIHHREITPGHHGGHMSLLSPSQRRFHHPKVSSPFDRAICFSDVVPSFLWIFMANYCISTAGGLQGLSTWAIRNATSPSKLCGSIMSHVEVHLNVLASERRHRGSTPSRACRVRVCRLRLCAYVPGRTLI